MGAGTFQPVKEHNAYDHAMHSEPFVITFPTLENIIQHIDNIVAVGTTSLRTLESIYWYGVKLLCSDDQHFVIEKLYPYQYETEILPSKKEALEAVLKFMDISKVKELIGQTEIFIFPGYTFRICDGLITNYHMPKSTLILLVAAFVGENWRTIYYEALKNDYRFLSYGDSSLLLP